LFLLQQELDGVRQSRHKNLLCWQQGVANQLQLHDQIDAVMVKAPARDQTDLASNQCCWHTLTIMLFCVPPHLQCVVSLYYIRRKGSVSDDSGNLICEIVTLDVTQESVSDPVITDAVHKNLPPNLAGTTLSKAIKSGLRQAMTGAP
jgi:hypothetical protein